MPDNPLSNGVFECGACRGRLFRIELRAYRFVEMRLWIICPCGWSQWVTSYDPAQVNKVKESPVLRNPGV